MFNLGQESETVEFKTSTRELKEAMASVCAMLNKHCQGTVYFGINDSGLAIGQMVSNSTKRDIERFVNDSIRPKINPTIETVYFQERSVVKLSFSGYSRPYSAYGDFLIRVGTVNRKMSADELKELFKNEDYSSKWESQITDKTLEDVNDETLFKYYNSAVSCGRLSLNKYNKQKLLTLLGFYKGGKLTNGGVALFGKEASINLKLANYATDNKITFLDLRMITNNICELVDEAVRYVAEKINWRVEIGRRKREEIPEIPVEAIREIVVNAFAHANYERFVEVEINVHPGKITIHNPGSFPDDLTPYDFIKQDLPSYKRNELILDALFRSKEVEKSGTGFQRVNELCKKNGVGWTYQKIAYGFTFEFKRTNVPINVSTNVPINDDLNENEKKVYKMILENGSITREKLAKGILRSEKTIQRIIKRLIEEGYIQREGSNKSGYWKILK